MNIQQYKADYEGLGSADVRSLISSSSAFRAATEEIYRAAFRENLNTACQDCWFDAYVRIMATDAARLSALSERLFVLKAGAVLEDVVNNDRALMVNRHTCTDTIALYHLRTCPAYIRLFEVYPDNWQTLARESDPEVMKAKTIEAEARRKRSTQTTTKKKPSKKSKK